MGGLLNTARRFLHGLSTAPATARGEAYAVVCPSGHRLIGARTEGYQVVSCSECGEPVFVLPRSPLPLPTAHSKETKPETKPRASVDSAADDADAPVVDDEIEWVDERPAPAPPRPRRDSPEDLAAAEIAESAPKPQPAPKPRPRARASTEPTAAEQVVAPHTTLPWRERLRRHRSPLIFTGVALVVAGTIAFRWWRAGLEELPELAERGRVEGIAALDAGDFDRAYQLLSAARTAVQRLGGEFQGASAIVQAADEAEVIVRRISSPLEDILDEATRTDPSDWSKRFDSAYKGRTILIVDDLKAVPDSRGNGHYELQYQIFPIGEGIPKSRGHIDLDGFKLLESLKPRVGDRLRFGAAVASIRMDVASGEWLVGLEPESGVILTHEKALEALGLSAIDEPAAEERP